MLKHKDGSTLWFTETYIAKGAATFIGAAVAQEAEGLSTVLGRSLSDLQTRQLRVEVSLSKIPNSKLLLMSRSAPCMAACDIIV